MAALQLYFLGSLTICYNRRSLAKFPTLKTQSLFAYLVMHGRTPQSRAQIAGLFWGDRPEGKARRSLNTALWHMRQALPDGDVILSDAQTVQFNPQCDYWLDAAEFAAQTQHLPDVAPEDETAVTHLSEAVALYRGDFLEGFYDDWCLEEQYRLESRYLEALERLAVIYELRRQPETALRYVMPLLARAPLREDVRRTAIRLQAETGNRAAALRLARQGRALLRAELDVELAPETAVLCDKLLGSAWRGEVDKEVVGGNGRSSPNHPAFIIERPPLVGRETEWKTLLSHWEQAKAGRGKVIWLSGEAGIGKSRLVEEVSQHIQQRGHPIIDGNCYEYEHALPYGPLTDLLHDALAVTDSQTVAALPVWQLTDLARLAPELSSLSQSPSVDEKGSDHPPGQDQARLFEALTRFLLDRARQNPLFILLEDMHWAHDSTLAWLHYLARHLAAVPILLIGTYRREEVDAAHPLSRMTLQMEQNGLAEQMELSRLSPAALAQWMLGADEALVTLIYRQTEGNPFFTLEILRDLVEKGQIKLDDSRWDSAALSPNRPIPTSIRQVVQMRLQRLSASTREAVAVAAVIGRSFDYDVLDQAWGQGEEAVLAALDELLRRRLIREGRDASGWDYAFDHHLLREVIYQGMHYRQRQRFHRLVGETLAQLSGAELEAPGEIAYHFSRAGKADMALHYYDLAVHKAKALFAWQEALRHLGEMLVLLPTPHLNPPPKGEEAAILLPLGGARGGLEAEQLRQRSQILEDRILLYSRLGQMAERDAELAALTDLAQTSGDEPLYLQSFIHRVRYLNLDGHYEPSIAVAEEGIALAERLNDVSAHCHLLAHIGFAHYFLGRPYPAMTALERALTLTGDKTDRAMQGRIAHYLGYVHFHLGDYAKSLAYQEEAYACHQATNSHTGRTWGGLDMGAALLEMGRYAESRKYLEEHLALARQIGSRSAEAFGLTQVGCWHLYRGEYVTAVTSFQQALIAHKGLRREHTQAEAEEGLGLAHLHLGNLTQAAVWLEKANQRARSIQHRRRLVKSLIGLGMVEIVAENYAEACLFLEEAVAIARKSDNWADLAAGLAALARAVRGAGEPEWALAYAQETMGIARERSLLSVEMWAELEMGLALLALADKEAAAPHIERASALLDRAHQLYLSHEQIRQNFRI